MAREQLKADAVKYANTDAAVQWYLGHGVPAEKIVLGLPFYGQIWSDVPDQYNGLYAPFKGRPGEEGTLSYREIQETYLPSYSRYWDDQVKVPWLYNKNSKIMISYEDPQSISIKVRYAIEKRLGGIMFWNLGQDDQKSTLLNTINQQLDRH